MAQINPFQGPINYAVDVQSPFEAAIGGFKVGQAGAEMQAQAQAREQKQKFQTGLSDFFKKPDRTYEDLEQLLPFADKQQFDALTKVGEGMEKRKLDTEKRFSAQTLLALESNVPVAKTMLQERAEAEKDPNQKRAFEAILKTIDLDPKRAAQMLELTSAATFGKDWYDGVTAARSERSGFKILSEEDRVKAQLPKGVYQIGPKGEIKLLSASKEQFKVLTQAEVKEEGLPPGIYQRGPNGEIKPVVKEPLVVVQGGGDQGKRDMMALQELDVPRVKEFSASAASARTLARDARVIANLLKGKGGGAAIQLGADVARTFGFSTDTVVADDLANSLAIRGATQLRPPGSGSTSDIEFKAFVSAFPSLANSESGRELMAKYADAFAKRTAKIADHARKLIRADNYSEEEIARFDESLGPILAADFYDLSKQGRKNPLSITLPDGTVFTAPNQKALDEFKRRAGLSLSITLPDGSVFTAPNQKALDEFKRKAGL
jgi:hypothetical protein